VIELRSSSLARFVRLVVPEAEKLQCVIPPFSDNYFDLPAGRLVKVTAELPDGCDMGLVEGALQISSLYDTY
jgi:hypothetical protein